MSISEAIKEPWRLKTNCCGRHHWYKRNLGPFNGSETHYVCRNKGCENYEQPTKLVDKKTGETYK